MIPFLIFMYIKKHGKKTWAKAGLLVRTLFTASFSLVYIGILLLLLSLIPKLSKSQTRQMHYTILQGDDKVGWLSLESDINGNRSTMNLISEVKTRILFLINVSTKESSTYENGKLIHSTLFRKNNGSVKLNKQTKFAGGKYEVVENGAKETLSHSFIGLNLLSLYFKEPVGIDMVYCDNHECFIKIIKMNDGGYKIKFPDGNSNCYYYSGGICTKIKIQHSFYSAIIIQSPKS